MPMDVDTHLALRLHEPTPATANGRANTDILASLAHVGDAAYHPCPEAMANDGVPVGKVTVHRDWDRSTVYSDTVRDLIVYVPATLASGDEAGLIVFNDGAGYAARGGAVRATRVLDTLHAAGEIAPTVAVFVNPGRARGSSADVVTNEAARAQRSFEYDSLTPDYGRFLLEDVLPFVARELSLNLTADPAARTVCGISSGGICAFTAAWHFPQHFGRVISHCGSYTNIRGGHNYPYLIRTTLRKPIRVYLQSGANDAETLFGDWPLANQTMANALAYAGYDHRFEYGTGGHSLRHGGAIFADSLRWLWRADALP